MLKAVARTLFTRTEVRHAVKTGIAAALSLIAGAAFAKFLDHPSMLLSGTWTVLTAIVVMQAHLGGTYQAAWERFLGTLIGSCAGSIFTYFFGSHPLSLGLSIAFTTMICSLMQLKRSIRIANLSVAIIVVMWGSRPDISPFHFGLYRFLDATLGIVIAVSIAHSLWPAKARMKLRYQLSETILSLNRLFRLVTRSHTNDKEKEKVINRLMRSTDSLLLQNRMLLNDSRLEILSRSASIDDWEILIRYLDTIFESISALRNVRKKTLFEMMDNDLQSRFEDLVETIDTFLMELAVMLEKDLKQDAEKKLEPSALKLKEELVRFRTTKTTRRFNLHEVEQYFVFFYQLRSIVADLIQIESKIHALRNV